MSKYDVFCKVESPYAEDMRPLRLWHKVALWLLLVVVALFWLTPDAPAKAEARPASPMHPIHCAHIHRRICGLEDCRVVDVPRLCWRSE
ncbi:MAG: hypothetical protein KGL39_11140 [Patescibacteria group bacterium]|nr:hypothetical protein [Patescibacteria group bacterium]